eukprot:TRINITY_DN4561_c2_g1_i3.p1 TRINITY_DN4561_c2_g1~~TRINITY_DN4561_c2_g1_i3.p1  ORF type:complete len:456 (+),score=91.25 TRINITY_DN4561_c2_g1_i3:248-1615(+)
MNHSKQSSKHVRLSISNQYAFNNLQVINMLQALNDYHERPLISRVYDALCDLRGKGWGVTLRLPSSVVTDTISPQNAPSREDIVKNEGNDDDLVFESWAACTSKWKYSRSKEDMMTMPSGVEFVNKRHTWRRRTEWVAMDCGEDSFFVSNTRKVVGVADGVGSWRQAGFDPSEISNNLMKQGKHISETERDNTSPGDILTKSYNAVLESGEVRGGSTTALLATIDTHDNKNKAVGKATATLNIANLGDSGLVVFRKGNIVYRAKEISHKFNTPYQLAVVPRKFKNADLVCDLPEKATSEAFTLREDDVVIMGSDGYFDNTPNSEILQGAEQILNTSGDYGNWLTPFTKYKRNERPRMYPKDAVKSMLQTSILNAKSKTFMTPFSYGLLEQGVDMRQAAGGKPDDITIMVIRIVRRKNWRQYVGVGGGEGGSIRDKGGKFHHYVNRPDNTQIHPGT